MICNTLPNILLTKGIFLAFTVMDSALVIVFSLLFFLHGRQFGFGKLLPRIWLALLLRSLLMLIWTTARRTCLLTKLEINFIYSQITLAARAISFRAAINITLSLNDFVLTIYV